MTLFDLTDFRSLVDIHNAYNAHTQSGLTDDGLFNPFFLQFVQGVPDMLETRSNEVIALFGTTPAQHPQLKELYDRLKQFELPWLSYSVDPNNIAQYKLEEQVFVVGSNQENPNIYHLFVKAQDFENFNQVATRFMEAEDLVAQEESYYTPGDPNNSMETYDNPAPSNQAEFHRLVTEGATLAQQDDIEGSNRAFENAVNLAQGDTVNWLYDIIDYNEELREGNFGDLLELRGQRFLSLELYQHAIEDFSKAMRLGHVTEYGYNFRGLTYQKLHNHEKAIEDFTKAIEIAPWPTAYFNNRGGSYHVLQQFDLAIADYKSGISHDDDNPHLHMNLAMALFDLARFEEAIQYYQKTMELAPGVTYIQINLAELYLCMGRYEEAQNTLAPKGELLYTDQFPMVAEIVQLILAVVLQTATADLEAKLIQAQQQGVYTGWSFKNVVRWFDQTQDLSENARSQIQQYLAIASSISAPL